MDKLGFVFSTAPHGSASGREGLDAVLATSNYNENLALFFVGDGVMQLLSDQHPSFVLCRDYIATFKMLSLCDVKEIYVCHESLIERGVFQQPLIVNSDIVTCEVIAKQLSCCLKVLQF
ncbi:sulfurtransferase complex subunit TusC [Candidatus Enterovibrio altilux]|uniref:Protein TusC homolog n=1 Tax=Candidatus Enterovibrio altilux TaxID=1927128 RepID=A0A291BA16_9GAMM|nr:sulfurtransferase complex subunit TusC [Candidatus Enterovibrio luxaltus]ATF09824.1 tRNA 5-methylaminomethyl-2-thiouridine synthase TusC [Candidatus Enterovibrio luxaltus]